MPQEVQIGPDSSSIAKIRNPVLVVVWSFITIGIYYFYWWYQINREMADLGKSRNTDELGDNPTMSLLAFIPGCFILIPPYVSLYNGVKRMQKAQEILLGEVSLNGWIALILLLLLGPILPGYLQSEMNHVWENIGGASTASVPETPSAPQT